MINRALVSEEEMNCKFDNIGLPNKILILKFMLHLLFFYNQGTIEAGKLCTDYYEMKLHYITAFWNLRR